MKVSTLQQMGRKHRKAKTLLQRARRYIGVIKGPLKPKKVAARAKSLVREIVIAKHSRL
jgi:hypothetical protein